jgi:hypothetical protein
MISVSAWSLKQHAGIVGIFLSLLVPTRGSGVFAAVAPTLSFPTGPPGASGRGFAAPHLISKLDSASKVLAVIKMPMSPRQVDRSTTPLRERHAAAAT